MSLAEALAGKLQAGKDELHSLYLALLANPSQVSHQSWDAILGNSASRAQREKERSQPVQIPTVYTLGE